MKYPQVYFHQYITRPDMETLRHKYRQKMEGKTKSGDNTRLGRTVVVGPFALRNDVPPEVLAREGEEIPAGELARLLGITNGQLLKRMKTKPRERWFELNNWKLIRRTGVETNAHKGTGNLVRDNDSAQEI